MKYINRYHLGLEQFLMRFSPAFRLENIPENYASLLLEQPFSLQLSICRDIQSAMHQLMTSEFQVRNSIPASVRDLGETQLPLTSTQVAPFFQWLQKLHQDNQNAKNRWEQELDRISRRLGEDLANIFRSLSVITFQRIRFMQKGQDLILSSGNLMWGEFHITLENAVIPEAMELPQCGYLFWVEGEELEDGYEFRLLMDREFSDTIYGERLLQSRNWLELTLQCSSARVEFKNFDYTQRALDIGLSAWDTVRFCCYELIHKSTVMQYTQLSSEEQRLADVAQLFLCTGLLDELRAHSPITFLSPVNLLENRYKFQNAVRYLRTIWGELGEFLCNTLEEIEDAYDEQHRKKYSRALGQLTGAVDEMVDSGLIRKIALPLLRAFRESSAGMGMDFPFGQYLHSAADTLKDFYEKLMEQYQFQGEFPHYYRERGNLLEFFSFVQHTSPFTRSDGNLFFTYAIQLARCPATIDENGKLSIDGISPEECRAADFQSDKSSRAHFAIVGDDIDGQGCLFSYPLGNHPGEEYRTTERKFAAKFGDTLILAMDSLNLDPIRNKEIAQRHRIYLKKNHVFQKLFQKWSVLAIPLILLLIVPGFSYWKGIAEILSYSIGAVLVALGIVCLVCWIAYGRKRRYVWNRDKL